MQWDDDTKICIVFRLRFQLLTRKHNSATNIPLQLSGWGW